MKEERKTYLPTNCYIDLTSLGAVRNFLCAGTNRVKPPKCNFLKSIGQLRVVASNSSSVAEGYQDKVLSDHSI
jgi:hypothetical protein